MYSASDQNHKNGDLYRWTVVALLWCICVLNYADRQAVFSVFTILEKTYGLNKKELGLIGSSFMVVYATMSPLAGVITDRFSRKWIIIGGLCTWSFFTGFTSLCSKLWAFVFVRGAEGLGETFYFPASTALISDYHGQSTRSRALGFHHTGTHIGVIVGGVLTGWLAEKFGWQTPFLIFGFLGVGFALILTLCLREPVVQEKMRPAPSVALKKFIPELARNHPALALVAVFMASNFVTLPFYAWLPTFISEKFHLSISQSAFAGTIYLQGSSAIGAVFGGHAADYCKRKSLGGRVFVQALGVFVYAPFMFWLSWTENFNSCVIAMCLLGLFKGMYDANVWAAFYDVVPVSRRATMCGFANSLAWLAGSLSVFLVGFIVDGKWLDMSETLRCLPTINIAMTLALLWVGRSLIQKGYQDV